MDRKIYSVTVVLSPEERRVPAELEASIPRGRSFSKPLFIVKCDKMSYLVNTHSLYNSLTAGRVSITLDECYSTAEADSNTSGFLYESEYCQVEIPRLEVDKMRMEILPILNEMRIRTATITTSSFYSTGPEKPDVSTLPYSKFKSQAPAFYYFDTHSTEERQKLKIFAVEMPSDGHREYAVMHWDRFIEEYAKSKTEHRHVYEMIRDGFPCRLYFDLEYSVKSNPGIIGDDLTAKWIRLVAWKVMQLWGISLGPQNFVVFDSCRPEKYSKHVTVIIPAPINELQELHVPGGPPKELLFLDFSHVKLFVAALMADITSQVEEIVPVLAQGFDPNTQDTATSAAAAAAAAPPPGGESTFPDTQVRARMVTRPRPGYEWLYVMKEQEKGKGRGQVQQTCFVDLGVYTRNRIFRLYGSSKHPGGHEKKPKPILSLTNSDKKLYWGGSSKKVPSLSLSNKRLSVDRELPNSQNGQRELHLVNSQLTNQQERLHMYRARLEAGNVVPHDLFVGAPRNPRTMLVPCTTKERDLPNVNKRSAASSSSNELGLASPHKAAKIGNNGSISSSSSILAATKENSLPNLAISVVRQATASPSKLMSPVVIETVTSPAKVAPTMTVCDRLTFNPYYGCLVLHGGRGLVGEFPQNWVCHQKEGLGEAEGEVEHQGQPFLSLDRHGVTYFSSFCDNISHENSLQFLRGGTDLTAHQVQLPGQYLGSTLNTKFYSENTLGSGYGPSPFPYLDAYIKDYMLQRPNDKGGQGYVEKWSLYALTVKGGEEVVVKIKYTIKGGYKYCHNKGGHHKSNGVLLEVNLDSDKAAYALKQTCWDPDCRGFKSKGEPVPYSCFPEKPHYEALIHDHLDKTTDFAALENIGV